MDIDYTHRKISEQVESLVAHCRKLEQERDLAMSGGEIQRLEEMPEQPEVSRWCSWSREHKYEPLDKAKEKIDKWFKECKEIDARNKVACEHNLKILNMLIETFVKIGLRKTVSYQKTKRSGKWHSKDADWLVDLRSQIPTACGLWSQERWKADTIRKAEEYHKKIADEKRKKELEAEKEAKKRAADIAFVALCQKVGVDPVTASGRGLLDAVLSKCKYLKLAHWLSENRSDWSDGYSYAERGLDGFTVESEVDKEIESEISYIIANWEGDGRVFRDCEYNYSVLFGMVDSEAMKLYNEVNSVGSM